MQRTLIQSIDDPRLDPFRDLKTARRHRRAGLFVAEGSRVVRRLAESDFEILSILVSDRREGAFEDWLPRCGTLLVVPEPIAGQVAGYDFHQGILACGRRKPTPALSDLAGDGEAGLLLAACSRVDDPENVGAIIRLCMAFGIDGLLLGPGCADPFSRRVLRVSMGHAFRLPILESGDLRRDLRRLQGEHGCRLMATVLGEPAVSLESVDRPARGILLFGNEAFGLEPELTGICDLRITIPMSGGTDSLNVAVAAAIFLYHFTRTSSSP